MLIETITGAPATLAVELAHRDHAFEAPATLIGLEHEYRLARYGEPLDFRNLIHTLAVPGRRLDPGDANAYRLVSGLALTCDDAEAEIASPPLRIEPGFVADLISWAAEGRRQLESLLPADIECTGYSTHLSVSLPTERQPQVLERFCRSFGPVLMLLFDRPDGHGIYVRPRPGRIELCGDYLAGPELGAAAVLLAGGVRACSAAVDAADLPPALDIRLTPATGRYGLYLGRRSAFGFDLYAAGREAVLPISGAGGSITAQEQITVAWLTAREHLGGDASEDDLAGLKAVVSGERPLPVEVGPPQEAPTLPAPGQTLFGDTILRPLRRPGYTLETVAATWDFTLFRVDGTRRAFACVPRDDLAPFIDKAADGSLDGPIGRFLADPPAGRRLATNEATHSPGLWDEIAVGRELLAPEPDPQTGSYGPSIRRDTTRMGKAAGNRAGKLAARPGKLLAAPVSRTSLPLPVPSVPSVPERSEASPAPPLPPPEVAPVPPKRPVLIAVAVILISLALVTAVAAVADVFDNEAPATPTAMPTMTATATAKATLTPTPAPSATPAPTLAPAVVTVPVPTPTPVRTAVPTQAPPTPVIPTAVPTRPLPCDPPGALQGCTPTPPPSATPMATTTPTPTPTRTPLPTATPCVQLPGTVVCPTPSGGALP